MYLFEQQISINPSNVAATFVQSTMILKYYLNPVMLVFIGKLAEYYQENTLVPGFLSFFKLLCIIFYWPN